MKAKLICGPMATLSHEAFRRAVEKSGGCDEYFTEMINAPSLVNMGPFEKYYLSSAPVPEKIVWQLTSAKSEAFSKAAEIVALLGGIGIDLNMGCSAPQIYKTGAGISWMLKPLSETRSAVRGVKNVLAQHESATGKHMRLSVKCRLGAEDFTEDTFFSFTDMLAEEGVKTITLHPRTVKEKYRLSPKYEYIQKLAERYSGRIKIYANGGINSTESLNRVKEICPLADGFMIARAAAQKPWIFAELSGLHSTVDAEQLALDFIDDVEKYQPEEFHKTRLQRFFAYYCQNFSFAHYFQTQMTNAHSLEESRERVKDYFTKQPGDKFINY